MPKRVVVYGLEFLAVLGIVSYIVSFVIFALSDAALTDIWKTALSVVQAIALGFLSYKAIQFTSEQKRRADDQEKRAEASERARKAEAAAAAAGAAEVKVALIESQRKLAENLAKQALATQAVAEKADQVKATLATSTSEAVRRMDDLATVAQSSHAFLNSLRGELLKTNMVTTKRLAEYTKEQADIDAAEAARSAFENHQAGQVAVDAQAGTDAQKKGQGRGEQPPGDPIRVEVVNTTASPANVQMAPQIDPDAVKAELAHQIAELTERLRLTENQHRSGSTDALSQRENP
jgi:hypothetical protein